MFLALLAASCGSAFIGRGPRERTARLHVLQDTGSARSAASRWTSNGQAGARWPDCRRRLADWFGRDSERPARRAWARLGRGPGSSRRQRQAVRLATRRSRLFCFCFRKVVAWRGIGRCAGLNSRCASGPSRPDRGGVFLAGCWGGLARKPPPRKSTNVDCIVHNLGRGKPVSCAQRSQDDRVAPPGGQPNRRPPLPGLVERVDAAAARDRERPLRFPGRGIGRTPSIPPATPLAPAGSARPRPSVRGRKLQKDAPFETWRNARRKGWPWLASLRQDTLPASRAGDRPLAGLCFQVEPHSGCSPGVRPSLRVSPSAAMRVRSDSRAHRAHASF